MLIKKRAEPRVPVRPRSGRSDGTRTWFHGQELHQIMRTIRHPEGVRIHAQKTVGTPACGKTARLDGKG